MQNEFSRPQNQFDCLTVILLNT